MRSAPVSGPRITFVRNTVILPEYGLPPCYEPDGYSPVYFGSAILADSAHPCKVTFTQPTPALYTFDGAEVEHKGRYELLPFLPDKMELVRASWGEIPEGTRPVEGGYGEGGHKLYHAIASVLGVRVPGKTGEHLGACHIGFDGKEHIIRANYEILCWKEQLPIQDCST